MRPFIHELHSIIDLNTLISMKEQIKNQVVDPTVDWQIRMDLYKQVQLINERILQVQQK